MHDAAILMVALLATYLPGVGLMVALGLRRPVLLVALAPAASVGVAGATASVVAVLGLPYGAAALGAVTAVLILVGGALGVRVLLRRDAPPRRRRPVSAWIAQGGGLVVAGVGAGVGAITWLRGLDGLDTVAQEHDMIMHAVLAAYIERSGRGAPWQLAPADLLTGEPVTFYPSGLHLLAAVTSEIAGTTVEGLNAITVVTLAISLSLCGAALAVVAARQLRLATPTPVLVGGVASLVAAGLYKPTFQLMHDGGVLANAAALALTPGVLAGLLLLPKLPWRAGAAVGVACAGVVFVHPSAAVSVAILFVAWWAGQAVTRIGRAEFRGLPLPLLVTAGVGAVLAATALLPAVSAAGRTADFPPDLAPAGFGDALGSTLGLTYGGFLDPFRMMGQPAAAALFALGVIAVLALRRGFGPLTAWAAWALISLGAFLSPGSGLDALVTPFFYNAQLRVWSHVALLVPVLGGLGVGLTAARWAGWLRRHAPVPARASATALVALAAVGYLLGPAADYAETNRAAVASRYAQPDFVRVDGDDVRAIDWLAERVRPGQRVLNSANDGSTHLYIRRGIPIVNVYSLGLPGAPFSYRLLELFRSYPTNERIRSLLQELDVAWVYVDAEAPTIGSGISPAQWADPGGFTLAPGLTDLDGLPGLEPVFRSGSVTVYALDLDVVRAR